MSFQEHTSLLGADADMLHAQLNVSRRAANMNEWIEVVEKYRCGDEVCHSPYIPSLPG